MSTCKFYKLGENWFYKIRPGFDEGQPVTKEILFKALGVTGQYETTVHLPDDKGNTCNVKINNGITKVLFETKELHTLVEVLEFVVRFPKQDQTVLT